MCDGVFFFSIVLCCPCAFRRQMGADQNREVILNIPAWGVASVCTARRCICATHPELPLYTSYKTRAPCRSRFSFFGAWPVIDPCRHRRPEWMNEINIKIKARATIEGVSRSLFLHLVRRLPPFRRPQRVRNRRGRTSRACSEFWNMYAIPPRVLT